MRNHESDAAQGRPIWIFMAATAMATTVSTLAATAMVKAEAAEPVAVTCACEAPAAVPVIPASPVPAEAPVQTDQLDQLESPATPEQAAQRPIVQHRIDGAIGKDVIRRVVRAHIAEIRHCYNQGLELDPTLAGRVEVDFVIDSEGTVTRSTARSEMKGEVPECIANAVAHWSFPKPADGDDVAVTYPFELEPG